MWHRMDFCKSW